MTGGNEKTTFNMSAEFYKNQFIERYSFEDAGNFRVASQTNISKLAHIRMDFRGIMQSAWTRKG